MKKKITAVFIATILLISLFSFASCNETDKTKYSAEIVFDEENMSAKGYLKVEFVNTNEFEIDKLCFNVYGNAYRKGAKYSPIPAEKVYAAYDGKINYGYFDVESVAIGGEKVAFDISGEDKNLLVVPLDEPLSTGDKIDVEIEFAIKLAKVKHRLGYNDDTVNFGNFLPVLCVYENGEPIECPYYNIGDPFYSECADYFVAIKVPSEYTVAASGECVNTLSGGKFTTYTYSIENARTFAFSASKKFNVISSKSDGITVNYYYVKDDNPSKSYETATDALHTFIELFGEYPYKTFSVVETPFLFGGMEYPSIVFVSDSLEREDLTEAIVHETAHQWWYALVGTNEVKNAFLDEGLAQISTALFFDENAKYGKSRADFVKTLQNDLDTYKKVYAITGKTPDFTPKRALNEYSTTYEYTAVNYFYMPIVLNELCDMAGKDDFVAALRSFSKDNRFKNVTEKELSEAFKTCCKVPIGEVFDSLIEGKTR